MIDAMSIKKHITYDAATKTMTGFVDLGDGPDEDNVASEALMFMVVGLQSHWKAPVAYFITKTLQAETQKVLVEHMLHALHEKDINVVCMTMDGHGTNISMMSMLGCELTLGQPLKTHFNHPSSGQRVHVMLDACHMLKLSRNMLQAYSPIKSAEGEISWSYLVKLSEIQEKEGLHAATRLSTKHIQFHGQIMKVSLAAQSLSNSVAIALSLMKMTGNKDFQGCQPTIKFIQVNEVPLFITTVLTD